MPPRLLVALVTASVLASGCAVASTPKVAAPTTTTTTPRATVPTTLDAIPKPDPHLTPGATLPVTAAQVCVTGYTKKVRSVSAGTKNAVFAEYGIATHKPYSYEVDHLISLELGGSNDIRNLWPEPYAGANGARSKDVVENRLHAQVCAGTISLRTAQAEITRWWLLPR